jgi:hypothetical protein
MEHRRPITSSTGRSCIRERVKYDVRTVHTMGLQLACSRSTDVIMTFGPDIALHDQLPTNDAIPSTKDLHILWQY